MPAAEAVDVLIVGAGLSGIGAACHLREKCPDRSLLILEGREVSGGTWDLFRYPGIRADSDMHTLGYSFEPWRGDKAIADGPSILKYIRHTAAEHGIESLIRYRSKVTSAAFDSSSGRWTVHVAATDDSAARVYTATYLLMCAGYYSYDRGHLPEFPGRERFAGTFVHPQFWPEDLAYAGKRIIVVGSGATAMTLVPALAEKASEVVMLQRSPTYVISRPARDRIANMLRKLLPANVAYAVTRWKNTAMQQWFYGRSRRAPEKVRKELLDGVRAELGADYDVARHFTPSYNPWDQRLCLVPDSDLFRALRAGRARVVTDKIEEITAAGIRLASGEELAADIIVSATGLELVVMGGVTFSVDGEAVDFSQKWTYKGVMCSDVPNLVSVFGYINASWTLRADLTARWFCRLLNYLREQGTHIAVPRLPEELAAMPPRDWIEGFSAGYMRRVMHRFPRQGDRAPWLNPQNYRVDRKLFLRDPIADGALQFTAADGEYDAREAA